MLLAADGGKLTPLYAATGRRQSWSAGGGAGASRTRLCSDGMSSLQGVPTDTAEAGSIDVANGESKEMAA